jgi:lipopolysaccharide biosynthesis regulator YciM
MQIDKEQVLELLRSRGEHDKAQQAEQELPDQVDTDQHAGALQKFGLDPKELLGGLGGGLGGMLGR